MERAGKAEFEEQESEMERCAEVYFEAASRLDRSNRFQNEADIKASVKPVVPIHANLQKRQEALKVMIANIELSVNEAGDTLEEGAVASQSRNLATALYRCFWSVFLMYVMS